MPSEFAALLDLAISRGFSPSDLISDINREILAKFRDAHPKSPADATVFVNQISGDVRIFSGDADITPKDFANEAAGIARRVLIAKLGAAGLASDIKSPKVKIEFDRPKIAAVSSLLSNLFFFGYNIYFLFFNLVLAVSFFSGQFWTRPWQALKEFGLFRLLLSAVLFVTPAVAVYSGLKQRLFRRPGALLRLFFLFELPLVAACLFPLALLTQTTPFMILISLLTLSLPGIFYLYSADIKFSPTWQKAVYFVQQSVFLVGSYLGLLFAFFVPPILAGVAGLFFGQIGNIFYRPSYNYYGGMMPYPPSPEPILGLFIQMGIGLLVLLLVVGALLVPYLLIVVIWRALAKTRVALAEALSSDQLFTLDAVFAVMILTVSLLAAYQPTGNKLLQPLKDLSAKTSFADKETIAKLLSPQREKITALIKDKFQSRSKYLFTSDDTSLKSAYQYSLHFSDGLATAVQKAFLTLAYPFVYQGDSRDRTTLYANYQYLFGQDIYSTTVPAPVPVSAKNVLLTYRQVTVTPAASGLLAAVTVEEEYDNQTYSQQEVVYEFTLPRGAVMTDLRLGPDLEFIGAIAPKGAAQRTYERELTRRRDPALLEETGPRQYRLRVFPIPAKNDLATLKGRRQKVSFTYAVAAAPPGYPLPQITRKTNVYTTAASRLFYLTSLGNVPLKVSDTYVPVPANLSVDVCRGTSSGSTGLLLHAGQPDQLALACGTDREALAKISGLKIAFFYPVFAANSTSPQLNLLVKTLSENKDFVSANQLDLYKFNDLLSDKTTLTPDNLDAAKLVTFFGTGKSLVPLADFDLRYDLVFIFGSKSDAFTAADTLPFAFPTRVYYVNSSPPPFTMKLASQINQTGGDIVDSFVAGLRLYQLDRENNYVLNPYLTITNVGGQPNQIPVPLSADKSALTALTNQALFRSALTRFTKDVSGDVSVLDQLNNFSLKTGLVSPYSSLIALVNEQQQQTLDQLSQDYNRYQDQQLVQPVTPRPVPVVMDELQPIRSGSGIFGNITNLAPQMKSIGGGAEIGIMAPSANVSFGALPSVGIPNVGGLGLFVIANGLLLVFGLGFYLFRLLRPKTK